MLWTKGELRRDALSKIEGPAAEVMNDQKLNRFRGLGVRRTLATALMLSAILTALTYSMDGAWPLLNFVSMMGLWLLLARVNRGFMDVPDELIDERIRERRNETYRLAYMTVIGTIALIFAAIVVLELLAQSVLATANLFALAMAAVWFIAALPTAVFAWREPEV